VQSKERSASPINRKLMIFCASALLTTLTLGLAGYLWLTAIKGDGPAGQDRPHTAELTDLSAVPLVIPPGQPQWTAATVRGEMASCDRQAAKNPNGLYFLVFPVEPATLEAAAPIVPPPVPKDSPFFLIQSPSLLRGLGDGYLELSARPYRFSVLDTETRNVKRWNPANGASKFSDPNAPAISKFKIGFDFEDHVLTWTHEYDRQKGACYWVNLRIDSPLYAPHSGWEYGGVFKSFPNPAADIRCANYACERIEYLSPNAIKP
jgi:hypothetical protein